MRLEAAAFILAVVPVVASAHHSRAEYSAEVQEIEGTLVEVLWRNPHPGFTIEVDEDGE